MQQEVSVDESQLRVMPLSLGSNQTSDQILCGNIPFFHEAALGSPQDFVNVRHTLLFLLMAFLVMKPPRKRLPT